MKNFYFVLLTTVLLTACDLGPDYQRDPMQLPQSWNNTGSINNWPDSVWWQQFQSPRLAQLITQAQNANYDIKAAIARVRQAQAQAKIAGSALYPNLNIGASAVRSKASNRNSTVFGGNNGASDEYGLNLNASYELDFWGKNAAALEAAEAQVQASLFDRETIGLTITANVATTYFNILSLQDRLAVARQNLKATEDLLNAVRLRFNVGIVTALDVARQENLYAAQLTAIPQLELLLAQNKNALAVLLGQLPENLDTAADTAGLLDKITLPQVAAGLPSKLLQRRPDIARAETLLIAANANIKNARAQFFPSLVLTGQGGQQSGAFASVFGTNGLLYSVGASLTQPIFTGGLLEGQLELTQAQYDELLQNYRKVIVASFADVENALAAVSQNAQLVNAQEQAAQAAQTAFDLSQRQFQGGITDITTTLDTQQSLFNAQDLLVQAKAAYLQSIVTLYSALGGGFTTGAGVAAPNAVTVVQPLVRKPDSDTVVIE